MKKITMFTILLILGKSFVFGQNNESLQELNTPVQSAIIYLYGAEVTQSKQVTLAPGRNKIVFIGLSAKLDSKSIQVNTTGDVSILAISDAVNYLANQKESTKTKRLKDSATYINDAISQLNNDKEAYTTEKNMLLKNMGIGGNEKGVAIAELKLAADFYRVRIKEINSEIFKLDSKLIKLNETLDKTNQELLEMNAKSNQPSSEISILLSSPTKTTSTITLKYIVSEAGWAPSYELRAEDINQPIELKYRAKVFNNTGIDWNDIKIKLSTGDPSQSASKPVLETWNLDYYSQLNLFKNKSNSNAQFLNSTTNEGYTQNSLSEVEIIQKTEDKQVVKPIQFEEIQVSELLSLIHI